MCLAIPGKVIKIKDRMAWVKYPGVENKAMIGEKDIKIGDMVMVQMGIITKKLSQEEAEKMLKGWQNKE